MKKPQLTQTYRPNQLLSAVYRRFFETIQLDEGWAESIRRWAEQGTVIYVLRNLNWLDFFALDYLTKRHGLPEIRYVPDLGLWVLNPMGKGWSNALGMRGDVTPRAELEDAFEHGGTAALFLKRPPNFWDATRGYSGERGLRQGDELVRALFEIQRKHERPLLLVPLVFLWSKFPDKAGLKPIDFVLGPRHWPSPVRSIAQYLVNRRHVALKLGEPMNVRTFLDNTQGLLDEVRVRRITYAMLRRLERERRSITGPAEKPAARVRHEIVRSPKLRNAIEDLARVEGGDRHRFAQKALAMLREIQAIPGPATIKGMELLFNWAFHRIYRGIEYDLRDIARLRAASREGTLVLLPSHKSHIDYLILSYIFNEQNLPLPRIAAGDNLNFMPVGPFLRRGGAFFIRRSFQGDKLYATVVDGYVRRLIRDGTTIELFLEGGRSRTGKLLAPKFGLLSMVVDAALAVPQQRVNFVPVSIGYERVIEAGEYQRELSGGEKQKEDARGLFRTPEILRHRYGRINLQVGQILSLSEVRHELGLPDTGPLTPAKRRQLVTRLGNRVMDEINRVTAVTPGALAALALLTHRGRALGHAELMERCSHLLAVCVSEKARISPALVDSAEGGTLRGEAIREALQMFVDAGYVEAFTQAAGKRESKKPPVLSEESVYAVVEERRLALDTSKNILIHFFLERALVAASLNRGAGLQTPRAWVEQRVQRASRLFKHEFRFKADAAFQQIFDATLTTLQHEQLLAAQAGMLEAGAGAGGWSAEQWLNTFSDVLRSFFEGYRIAARGLKLLLAAPLAEKELLKRSLALGETMYLAGEIDCREAVSKPLLQNAHSALIDFGYVRSREGKLELTDTFNSLDAVAEIERWIAGYVDRSHESPETNPTHHHG
ncbi:MAG TPA: 1-acyl-sn-glycerol-3-phosphate acyltransferase [Polyangiaceae bacterium]